VHCTNRPDQVVHDETGLDSFKVGLRNMLFRPAIKACSIGPSHPGSQRLAIACLMAPRGRTYSNSRMIPVGLHDSAKLVQGQHLDVLWKNTEQKSRDGRIERPVGECEARNVHL
jgi:hypothetical protein